MSPKQEPSGTRDWSAPEKDFIRAEIDRLRPWSFSFDFGGGLTTRQGIDPRPKFREILQGVPADLEGKSCLDIGCNNGQLAMMLKDRGAERVVGIDHNRTVLNQAKFLRDLYEYDIELQHMAVEELPGELGRFDYVFCLGVLYHLRDMCGMMDKLVALTSEVCLMETEVLARNFDQETALFIEKEYRSDATNWWIPGVKCVMAMARASGFSEVELVDYKERRGSAFTREGLRNQARGAFRATCAAEKLVARRLEVGEAPAR